MCVKLDDHGAFVSFVNRDIVLFLQIGGYELDLPQFSRVVKQFGGLQKVARLFLGFLWFSINILSITRISVWMFKEKNYCHSGYVTLGI